jgi:predicted DNA-binding transcriptional regulator AlpA
MKQKQLPLKNNEFTAISCLTKVPVIDPLKRLIDLTWGEVVLELDRRYNSTGSSTSHYSMQSFGGFLNIDQCATLTGYKPGYIRQLVFKQAIPFFKSKGRKPVRFKEAEILAWMADRKFTPIDELANDYVDKKL